MMNYSASETPITPARIKPPPARPVSLRTLIIDICIELGLNNPGMCIVKTTRRRTIESIRQVIFVYFLKIMLTEATIIKVLSKYTQIIPPGRKEGIYSLKVPALII